MLFITLQSLPSFLSVPNGHFIPRLKHRQVPLSQWGLQVLVLTAGSLLNNWAFAYKVPLTVQIIFRSGSKLIFLGRRQLPWLECHTRFGGIYVVWISVPREAVYPASNGEPTPSDRRFVCFFSLTANGIVFYHCCHYGRNSGMPIKAINLH